MLPGETLHAGAFELFFWALNFTRLRLRFHAPVPIDFRAHRYFAVINFSRSYIPLLDFHARNFVLVLLYTARTGQPGQDTQNRTGGTAQSEQDRRNSTV